MPGFLAALDATGYDGYNGLEFLPLTSTGEALAWLPVALCSGDHPFPTYSSRARGRAPRGGAHRRFHKPPAPLWTALQWSGTLYPVMLESIPNARPHSSPTFPGRRSAALTVGSDRAGARAMMRAAGFTPADLERPIIGVCTSWIEVTPCNLNHRDLAQEVKAGIRAAGATPIEFNTIAVADGIAMGTPGMRASLVSRETIADSIELVVDGHLLDGLVCLVGATRRSRRRQWRWPVLTFPG